MNKKQLNRSLTDSRYLPALAFLIPLAIMIAAYISIGVYPFGDRAAVIIDSYHQYVPFFSELHYKIWHGESLFYSWHGSLGYNFLTVWAYYLASPLNFLVILFPEDMMMECFEVLILLKIALSGLTAYLYLSARTRKRTLFTVLFACFYALGGFMLAYSWNVMWLDSIYLFPLIVLGAERLIDEGRGLLYTVTLGIAIFCNYYIAIMICIFLICFFFIHWLSVKRTGFKAFLVSGFRYAGYSLLAGGMAGVILLPTYYTMTESSSGIKPTAVELYRSFADVLRQHMAMLEPTELTGAPNIYCGVIVCVLLPLYLILREVPVRKKVTSLLMAAFLLVSMNVNVLDYIWHGFHFPNNLPGRFSFIYILLVVAMAYEVFLRLKQIRPYHMLIAFAAEIFAFGLLGILAEESVTTLAVTVTLIFTAAYMVLIYLYGRFSETESSEAQPPAGEAAPAPPAEIKGQAAGLKGKTPPKRRAAGKAGYRKYRRVVTVLLAAALLAELCANTIYAINLDGSTDREAYIGDKLEYSQIREKYASDDKTFYRMELGNMRGRNDVILQNMNGLSYFSSTCNDGMEKLMGALGFFDSGNKYSYKGATPVTDAFLGIRYVICNKENTADNLELVETTEHKYIYENTDALSVGFAVNTAALSLSAVSGDPFILQNDLVRLASGIEGSVFTRVGVEAPSLTGARMSRTEDDTWYYDVTEGSSDAMVTFNLSLDQTQDLYLYFEAAHCDELYVEINGVRTTYPDEKGHIVHLGECGPEDEITLNFPVKDDYDYGNVKVQLYAYHSGVFAQAYEALADEQLEITAASDTSLEGTITMKERGVLFLSVPYDEGWTILVDGEETEAEELAGALTALRLEAGSHTIVMHYVPKGFYPGLALTLVSLILVVVLIFRARRIFVQKCHLQKDRL